MEGIGPISDPLNYAIGLMLGGGWLLVFWGIRKLFKGELATPPQIAAKDAELNYTRETVKELKYQNQLLVVEMGATLDAILVAVKQVAADREKGDSA
jgi:hypothetical protein